MGSRRTRGNLNVALRPGLRGKGLRRPPAAETLRVDPMPDVPLPITAFVVTHNEAERLRACLAALSFCSEILVVDKASTDRSAELARAAGAVVYERPADPPFVEATRAELAMKAAHPWVLFMDPDEIIPPALVDDIRRALAQHPDAGVFGLPFRYYFRGEPLRFGFWGRDELHQPRLVHLDRVRLRPLIHRGVVVKNGFRAVRIAGTETNRVQHAWANSYREVLRKHRRHLACEERLRGPSLRGGARFWAQLFR